MSELLPATVTAKTLGGLVIPATGNSIEPDDSILSAFGKLQAQRNTSANGLRFVGTWDSNIDNGGTNNAPNGTPALLSGGGTIVTGTTTSIVADQLVDSTKNFGTSGLNVAVGERVYNQAGAFTTVSAAVAATQNFLILNEDIFTASLGQTYSVDNDPALNQGEYYVVNAINATLARNATLNTIQNWQVGDWVIAGANNTWERLDQTSVEGVGTVNTIPKWTSVTGIADSSITDTGALITLGNATNLGDAATDAIKSVGSFTANENLFLKKGVGVGASNDYGTAGFYLATSGNALTAPSWTVIPDTGVTSVTGGAAITVTGTAAVPIVSVDYIGADNLVLSAGTGVTPALTDTIIVNDITTGNVAQALIGNMPFNNYSWKIADASSNTTVSTGNIVKFLGSGGISTSLDGFGDITITGSENPGTGTQFTLPVWDTTSTLGDSMVSQDAATGTKLTISADDPILLLNDTSTGAGSLEILHKSSDQSAYTSSGSSVVGALTYGFHIFKQQQGTDTSTLRTMLTLDTDNTAKFNGDVGIGITPLAPLHVKTASNLNFTVTANSSSDVRINAVNDTVSATVPLEFNASNYEFLGTGATAFPGNTSIGNTFITLGQATKIEGNLDMDNYNISNVNQLDFGFASGANISGTGTNVNFNGLSATFTGNVEIDGNLTVDGSIIHGGGGGGTAKGGTFTKLYTTGTVAAGAATAFSISRATTGSMVFDVMFTGGTRASSSVTKKFTVVKQYGNADSFISTFKILDTGPGIGNTGTDDFTVDFEKKDTDGLGLNCTIAAVAKDTQKIGITIILGFGENDATIVMNA